MNLTLLSFCKSKAILNMVLALCFSITALKAQMITTYAGNGSLGVTGDGGLATSAPISFVFASTFDAAGNLYIGLPNAIRKISTTGIITNYAGNGTAAYTGDGGLATAASVANVRGLAFDAAGDLYFSDSYHGVVRKIDGSGIISTVVGNVGSGSGFSGDGGLATAAQLSQPLDITFDAAGNLYIADSFNSRIRKVNTSGIITTIAGNGSFTDTGDGGLASNSSVVANSVVLDAAGNIYIGGSCVIRKINTSGIISTVAGTSNVQSYAGDGGLATAALLNQPLRMVADASGNLFFTEYGNNCVRKINASGIISTFSGNGTVGFFGDGSLPSVALLNHPTSLCFDPTGNLYIADLDNYRVRKVDYSATPICPTNVLSSKNRGINGSAVISSMVSPMVGTPTYFGKLMGNPLSNPMATVNYTTSVGSYTQTFPGNGIYNISVTSDDTISGYHCMVTGIDTILINNSSAGKQFNRRFTIDSAFFCNSGHVMFTDSSRFNYSLTNALANYTIVTNWGNGTSVTNTVNATNQLLFTSASTLYNTPGVYTIQSIIMGSGIPNDTALAFVNVYACGNFYGSVYDDSNSDCVHQWTELGINGLKVSATNGTNTYIGWADVTGYYNLTNVPAGTYTIQVDGAASGYTTICTSSLPHVSTIFGTNNTLNDFGMSCTGVFDIAATGISLWSGLFPGQVDMILPHVGILNGTCNFVVPGQVKMILTPCIQYISGGSLAHVPDVIIPAATGDTLVWNVADINNIGNFGYWNYAVSVTTCTSAVVGDSACITMMLLPNNGDFNTANNMFTSCFGIGVSYDPNYKEVTPKGYGAQGYIPATTNELTYTLHFQNTGTAKATNIYLLDTLSTNVDLSTIEIISSSHTVQPYLLPGGTMKFMFAYINLPDSTTDEAHSHGYVTYRIKLNNGLTPGTQIKNTGYIYFDYNSPVITNTTLNTIELLTILNKYAANVGFNVFPNPAQNTITVRVVSNEASNIMLYDVLGNEVNQISTSEMQSHINVSDLVNGVYFVRVNQKGKTFTQKIMIQR
ncbi:MAG: T9SS type A sorting domain-containing protein [Bacteroidota bacterium]